MAGQLSSFFFAFLLTQTNAYISVPQKEIKRLTGIFKLYFDRKVVTHVFSLGKKMFITLIAWFLER